MIDIKSDGGSTFEVIQASLEPLRAKAWLIYFDGTTVTSGSITVIGSGDISFDLLTSNETYIDIFFDAPLISLAGDDVDLYTTQNSYYASAGFEDAVGKTVLGCLTGDQKQTIKDQVAAATEKGLKARYWDTSTWPAFQRDQVWDTLMSDGVGMLSVDDLDSAKNRNWK